MLHRDCCCGVEAKVGQHSIPSFGRFAPCWPCRVESGFRDQGLGACLDVPVNAECVPHLLWCGSHKQLWGASLLCVGVNMMHDRPHHSSSMVS